MSEERPKRIKMTQETKICQNCKNQFTIEPEDFLFYEKIKVPSPTFCPECRLRRRLLWRNEKTLYKRSCDVPGHTEQLLSTYSIEKPFNVYDQKYWWGDQWDPLQFGRKYDFAQPFFEQFRQLMRAVPHPILLTEYTTCINSDYSNWAGELKNCYLISDADVVQDSAYGSGVFNCKDCFDNGNISESELSAHNFNIHKCYRTVFSVDCSSCTEVWLSKNCIGCTNCFGCVNLRNKSYHIFNVPYDRDNYFKKLEEFRLGSFENFEKLRFEAEKFWNAQPQKYMRGFSNTRISGDYIYHSKNVQQSFLITDVEDSKFVVLTHVPSTKDCYDYTDWGYGAERLYECMTVGLKASNIKFSHIVFRNVMDVQYSFWCGSGSSNLFGCTGLRNKQYCILNRQYTKEEYESLVPKIIKHMNSMPYVDKKGRVYKYGEFFPSELSPFSYNETIAQEYFPLTKEQAIEQGYSWKDPEPRNYEIQIKNNQIPDHIKDVTDDIINKVIECAHNIGTSDVPKCNEQCTEAFKIIPQELAFYRKMSIPLPRLCPNCRHYQRIKQRNPLKLWPRRCECEGQKSKDKGPNQYTNTATHIHGEHPCPNEFETSYAPERPEIVYCEACYNSEVV